MIVVNNGLRKFTFKDGEVLKELLPSQEKEISKEAGLILVQSFPKEIFIVKDNEEIQEKEIVSSEEVQTTSKRKKK